MIKRPTGSYFISQKNTISHQRLVPIISLQRLYTTGAAAKYCYSKVLSSPLWLSTLKCLPSLSLSLHSVSSSHTTSAVNQPIHKEHDGYERPYSLVGITISPTLSPNTPTAIHSVLRTTGLGGPVPVLVGQGSPAPQCDALGSLQVDQLCVQFKAKFVYFLV